MIGSIIMVNDASLWTEVFCLTLIWVGISRFCANMCENRATWKPRLLFQVLEAPETHTHVSGNKSFVSFYRSMGKLPLKFNKSCSTNVDMDMLGSSLTRRILLTAEIRLLPQPRRTLERRCKTIPWGSKPARNEALDTLGANCSKLVLKF